MTSMRKGDIGTVLRWTVSENGQAVDVSPAITKQVKIIKPNGTQITKSLSNSTKDSDRKDGTDGRVEYVTVAGDIDQKGTYNWQLFIVVNNWTGNSQRGTFIVEDVLF